MGNNAKAFLKEWIVNFIINRDAISRNVISVGNGKEGFDVFVKYKDKEQHIIVEPVLDGLGEMLAKFKADGHYGLVIFNSIKNFNVIVENWEKLVKFRFLCIYFVNPFSSLDKKWLIYPYTHNSISDPSSLKTGLKSMFEMVEPVSGERISKI